MTKHADYAKALAHPLRVAILQLLDRKVASPSELAPELDAPLGNVSYHVRYLYGLGMLELTDEKPRRGAVEHYYTARVRVQFTVEPIIKSARRRET